ncbi:MAG: type IV pilus modification protein PilV [Pseudomonadota bacterium]
MLSPRSPRRHQAGFSLLEVLVALVVLSIGLMGIASMQVVGLQFNQQAMTTARAIELAGDMADRIRASNDAGRMLDVWDNSGGAAVPVSNYETDFGPAGAAPATPCSDFNGATVTPGVLDGCSATAAAPYPAALANFDVWQWKTSLAASTGSGLADGAGAVTHQFDGITRVSTYTIDVRWSDRGQETHYVLELRL